jgi:hypothetical protein
MNCSPYIGKALFCSVFGFAVLSTASHAGPTASKYRALEIELQKTESGKERPPIIKENTVVFLSLSKDDYDTLIKRKPEIKDGLIEFLQDFLHYADQVASELNAHGITAEFAHWKELWFQAADGSIIKKTFNPEEGVGLALFAKGKPPIMMRPARNQAEELEKNRFTPDFSSMAAVISKYFGVEIK